MNRNVTGFISSSFQCFVFVLYPNTMDVYCSAFCVFIDCVFTHFLLCFIPSSYANVLFVLYLNNIGVDCSAFCVHIDVYLHFISVVHLQLYLKIKMVFSLHHIQMFWIALRFVIKWDRRYTYDTDNVIDNRWAVAYNAM